MLRHWWAWWLLSIVLALLVLGLFQLGRAEARLPEEPSCVAMVARRHDAWNQVFSHFPERVDLEVDGFIATRCNEIGQRYTLWLNGHEYLVSVADCRQREHVPADGHPALDVGYRLWYHSGAPNAPTPALLCTLP